MKYIAVILTIFEHSFWKESTKGKNCKKQLSNNLEQHVFFYCTSLSFPHQSYLILPLTFHSQLLASLTTTNVPLRICMLSAVIRTPVTLCNPESLFKLATSFCKEDPTRTANDKGSWVREKTEKKDRLLKENDKHRRGKVRTSACLEQAD